MGNRMYNFGQMFGSIFFLAVPSYTPQGLEILSCFIFFGVTVVAVAIGSVIPHQVASIMPEHVAAWILPAVVGLMQLATRFMSVGIFKKVHELAHAGRVPKAFSATMAFYGQLGCVGGNILLFIILHL